MNELESRIQEIFNQQGYFIARDFVERRIGEVVDGIRTDEEGLESGQVVVIGTASRREFVNQCRKYRFKSEPGPFYYRVVAE